MFKVDSRAPTGFGPTRAARLIGLFLAASLFAASRASGSPSGAAYTVDLARAIAATPEGARIRALVRADREAAERRFHSERAELLARRGEMGPETFAEAAAALNERVAQAEAGLAAEQDRWLAPIIEGMRARVATAEASGERAILSLDREPPIGAPAACDRTDWLAGAAPAPKDGGPACRFRFFFYVDVDRVARTSRASRLARARLDALREERQGDLERRKEEVAALDDRDPARAAAVAGLERAYADHQEEIERRTREEEAAVYEAIRGRLEAALRDLPRALFVEAVSGVAARLEPRCDATEWAAALLEDAARVPDLMVACPSWAGPR